MKRSAAVFSFMIASHLNKCAIVYLQLGFWPLVASTWQADLSATGIDDVNLYGYEYSSASPSGVARNITKKHRQVLENVTESGVRAVVTLMDSEPLFDLAMDAWDMGMTRGWAWIDGSGEFAKLTTNLQEWQFTRIEGMPALSLEVLSGWIYFQSDFSDGDSTFVNGVKQGFDSRDLYLTNKSDSDKIVKTRNKYLSEMDRPLQPDGAYAASVADAVMLFAEVMTQALNENRDLKNGAQLVDTIRHRKTNFTSMAASDKGGLKTMNADAELVEALAVLNFVKLASGQMVSRRVGVFSPDAQPGYSFAEGATTWWPGNTTTKPKAYRACPTSH